MPSPQYRLCFLYYLPVIFITEQVHSFCHWHQADLRYFRATGAYDSTAPIAVYPAPLTTMPSTLTSTLTDTSANALANAALSGLHFWRANVGVAIRW